VIDDSLPNWFANDGQINFSAFLSGLAGSPARALQIGAYTGDASLWLCENVLTHPKSSLTDVDTWEGSEEPVHDKMDWKSVEDVYEERTKDLSSAGKIVKYKGTSDEFFKQNTESFDFVYVDGDHTSYGVLKDAVNAFEALKPGGILAFDDYQWSAGLGELKEPKRAVDAFWSVYQDRLVTLMVGYQCWFKKL
jgi:predicted O-methyltransferase YrrM